MKFRRIVVTDRCQGGLAKKIVNVQDVRFECGLNCDNSGVVKLTKTQILE